jgi:hypothetical protein
MRADARMNGQKTEFFSMLLCILRNYLLPECHNVYLGFILH